MNYKFEVESWSENKSKDFELMVSTNRRKEIFHKLGYDILDSGEILDKSKGEKIKGKDNEVINLNKSPKIALISGSHYFVRNIAEYSDLLAEKGDLKFVLEEDSLVKE